MENRFSLGSIGGGGVIGKLKRPKSSNRLRGGGVGGGGLERFWVDLTHGL